MPEKELYLSQLLSAHNYKYTKGTLLSSTNPSLDININSSSSELNKINNLVVE
jgi:hypothetical protein